MLENVLRGVARLVLSCTASAKGGRGEASQRLLGSGKRAMDGTPPRTARIGRLAWALALSLTAVPACADWTAFGPVTETYTHGAWTQVALAVNLENPEACPLTSYYAIDATAANYKGILATILSAQLSGRKVRFYIGGGCVGQGAAYPRIISVVMQ